MMRSGVYKVKRAKHLNWKIKHSNLRNSERMRKQFPAETLRIWIEDINVKKTTKENNYIRKKEEEVEDKEDEDD